jgi:hypothetical protein
MAPRIRICGSDLCLGGEAKQPAPGKLVRLRTNNRWAILDYATGPEGNAPIEQLKGVNYVCGVCVRAEIEVYFIPADRMDAHY